MMFLFPDAGGSSARYLAARSFVIRTGRSSGSFVARGLGIGFNEAMRHLERMEAEGVIAPAGADGRRAVLRSVPPAPSAAP